MKLTPGLLTFFLATTVFAQKKQLDLTCAFGHYEGSLSGLYTRTWHFGNKRKFEMGVGVRVNAYAGQNQYYITAPAALTSGSTGPLVIFKQNIVANIDTFLMQSPRVVALNVPVHVGYKVSARVTLGFNIDVVGVSFGNAQTGRYINGIVGQQAHAKPTSFNILLISDNDRGTLNSELFLKYQLRKTWGFKSGLQFLFTEYTTIAEVQQIPEPNDRFRDKSLLIALGVYKIL